MANKRQPSTSGFPIDPLAEVVATDEYRRSVITGILDSYNSNYDFLVEAVQNAVDALEDAKLSGLPGPYILEITVNLHKNCISVLDTGIGLSRDQIVEAFKPHVSLKNDSQILNKRGRKHSYRGYKGVGLTFLAYGTDEVTFHTKSDGELIKTRMMYGRKWARGERDEPARIDVDDSHSRLDEFPRGTLIKVRFSSETRPKSLVHLAAEPKAWEVIVRTRTAAGQILLHRESLVPIQLRVRVIRTDGEEELFTPDATFLYPSDVERREPFQFLDVFAYHQHFREQADVPSDKRRQDGLYVQWDTDKIRDELTQEEKERFSSEISKYEPTLYAFVPYQSSVWREINNILTSAQDRRYVRPGMIVSINRQRLADLFEIKATRYESFSHKVLVVVHFDGARPDQGRKTVQEEVLGLANAAANRAVQYLAKQQAFLRPVGEAPTPQQRQVERNHQEWQFNVQSHAKENPLHIPPVAYSSRPLTEQDVVGLFNQLCALGIFPGIRVFATSQQQTYDCLIGFDCSSDIEGLQYGGVDNNPLGLSSFIIGENGRFETRNLTLEFKNNLDALVDDIEDPGKAKSYGHIDICVCWATVDERFEGYELKEVTETNLEERQYPGVTHILYRDGEASVIQVIMLKSVVEMIEAGQVNL